MALTGIHVVCGLAFNVLGDDRHDASAALFIPIWSETIAAGAMTTQTAIGPNGSNPTGGNLIFRIKSGVEAYAAVGAAPDASLAIGILPSTARMHLTAGSDYDIPVKPGFKLAAVAA